MSENPKLSSPKYWPSWLGIGLARLIALLSYPVQMKLGDGLGTLARWATPWRRHVTKTNLAICFPQLSKPEQEQLTRAHFRSVGRAIAETAICWWGSDKKIQSLSHIEGYEHLAEAAQRGKGIVLLSAHFTALELGVRIGQQYLRQLGLETTAMYKPPHDPVINHVMRTRREFHIGGKSIPNKDIRGFIRALKRGDAVWYAGDQRPHPEQSELVPFFGQQVHTHIAISRLAKMTGATILPFFTLRLPKNQGYQLVVMPPLDDIPSGDAKADALKINQLIETVIQRAPEQYFWLHERFLIKKPTPYNPYRNDARQ